MARTRAMLLLLLLMIDRICRRQMARTRAMLLLLLMMMVQRG
jgi:hypothetical protein